MTLYPLPLGFQTEKLESTQPGKRTVRVEAMAGQAALVEKKGPDGLRVFLSTIDRSVFCKVWNRPGILRVLMIGVPVALPDTARLEALLPADADHLPIPDLPALVEAAVRDSGMTATALFCELDQAGCEPASAEDETGPYCVLTVSSHGFPAAVLVRAGEFFLPGRSCLPFGVLDDPRYLVQNIDLEPGDDLYLHSEIAAPGFLRQLHGYLKKNEIDPAQMETMVVLRLRIE